MSRQLYIFTVFLPVLVLVLIVTSTKAAAESNKVMWHCPPRKWSSRYFWCFRQQYDRCTHRIRTLLDSQSNPSNPSTILFMSNLSHSWGSYEMRANQMSTEINRLAPTYTSFHLTQPFLPSTKLNTSNSNYHCVSIKSIDPIMSRYCRTTLNASYVLDLVDAPVDQDHLPTLLNSPMHQMYQIFRQFLWINQTKSISTNTNTKYMDDNVDILLVASKKQQSIYQLVWPNIEIIVARHHHTNFHPQLVRDPECNKNANVVGMIGYTKDNINPSLLTNVQTILKQQDFTLQVIDQTGFNNIDGDINRKDVNVIDGGDRIGCPYLPIEDVPSLNRLKSLSTNGTTTGIVGQEVFHRLENTPSFGLLWPPMQHSKNVTRLFGLVKPVTRLLW